MLLQPHIQSLSSAVEDLRFPYKLIGILIVCPFVHAFIDSLLPSSKSRNYLGEKGVSRKKEQEVTVMRGLWVWGQQSLAGGGVEGVVID